MSELYPRDSTEDTLVENDQRRDPVSESIELTALQRQDLADIFNFAVDALEYSPIEPEQITIQHKIPIDHALRVGIDFPGLDLDSQKKYWEIGSGTAEATYCHERNSGNKFSLHLNGDNSKLSYDITPTTTADGDHIWTVNHHGRDDTFLTLNFHDVASLLTHFADNINQKPHDQWKDNCESEDPYCANQLLDNISTLASVDDVEEHRYYLEVPFLAEDTITRVRAELRIRKGINKEEQLLVIIPPSLIGFDTNIREDYVFTNTTNHDAGTTHQSASIVLHNTAIDHSVRLDGGKYIDIAQNYIEKICQAKVR